MSETRITAQTRDPQKSTGHALRRSGVVPGVYYNRKGENRCLQFDANTLEQMLRKEIGILKVDLDGETLECLIREVQRHPVRRNVVHIDLMGIIKGQKIRVHVPVHTVGTARGIKEGGTLELVLRDLDVECEPAFLPTHIDLDVTGLGMNEGIRLGDIHVEGVHFHGDHQSTVVHVIPPRTSTEPVAGAAAAEVKEPEVIRERKTDEDSK